MYSDPQDTTPMPEHDRLLAGRYRLLEKIGEGGAAEVFRATDERLDRIVAVKLLRPQFVDDQPSRTRFINEAKAAAGLSHPNIVDIYDFGEGPDGTMFIAMQYVDGQNLKDILQKRGRLSPSETVSIAQQVCYALVVAHAAGLIHRDVKPQNIMIDRSGSVRLTDFGIVKALSGPSLTQSGMTFGTAAYLSPEQATGEALGPPSDIYSLGCVMYEMLAGTPPFTGDNPAVVAYKQVWEQALPLHELVPEVLPSLERVVMRCLNKDPARRYPTADALATELENLKVGFNQPTQVMPLGTLAASEAKTNHKAPAPLASRTPAEISQPFLMPATAAAAGAVPPAKVQTTAYYGPPAANTPTTGAPPPPAYSGRRGGTMQVVDMQRRGRMNTAWVPFLLVLLILLGALAIWKGGEIFAGGGSNGGATTTSTPTAAPSPTTPLGGVVVESPTITGTATNSPSPVPTDTPSGPIELLPTATPIAPIPTVTTVPPTGAPVLPTDTPAGPPTMTPTEPPPLPPLNPTNTPKPRKGKPTPKPKDAGTGQGYVVTLDDTDFVGGYTRTDGLYHGITAQWVYGQGTQYNTMSAQFDTDTAPQGPASLTIRGLDSEDPAKTPIAISINGTVIYAGPDPLPDDFTSGVNGPGNWGDYTWQIIPGLIQSGTNTLSITNLDPSGAINQPPFFMLDYAQISWQQ